MPDFFGESEDFMRVMMPNGTLVTVEKAIPVNELRISFNGREMRLCERATEIGCANGISFLTRIHDNCGMPTEDTFIGNLRNESVREVLESLVRDGYVDLSGLKLQKARLMAIASDFKFDNGESGAYLLQGYEAACFTAVPGYPPFMGMGGAIPTMSKVEDAEDAGEEDDDE